MHITIVQRFVPADALTEIDASVSKIFSSSNAAGWELTAFKYYYIPAGPIGLGGIVVRPTPDLLELQQEIIAAVSPFTVATGTTAAFYELAGSGDPNLNAFLIDYVATFVPKASGDHFNPHVTIGIGPSAYLDKMLAEPFEAFTFSPVGASIYQLGEFGTARKKLAAWELGVSHA